MRRPVLWIGGLGLLVVLALLAAALIPGPHGSPGPFGVRSVAHASRRGNPLHDRVTSVFGSNVGAKQYGTQIASQEDQGVDASGQLASDLSAIPPGAFDQPIAAYRAYAGRWASKLAAEVPTLQSALVHGRRRSAEHAWSVAYDDYLHLGAVYGLLPAAIDQRIDGMPDELGTASHDPRFTGLHRIELGLWTGAPPQSLTRFAVQLGRETAVLRRAIPSLAIAPLDYATRAHEILEDAQRDLLSGLDVRWSRDGVLGTAAGTAATAEVISTLVPLLQGRDNTLIEVQSWLGRLQSALASVRAAHHGEWPSLDQLTVTQHERLNGTVAGALGALSLVPGTLETTAVPVIPSIPRTR